MRYFRAWVGNPKHSEPHNVIVPTDELVDAFRTVYCTMRKYDQYWVGGDKELVVLHDIACDWWYSAELPPGLGEWDEFYLASTSLEGLGLP